MSRDREPSGFSDPYVPAPWVDKVEAHYNEVNAWREELEQAPYGDDPNGVDEPATASGSDDDLMPVTRAMLRRWERTLQGGSNSKTAWTVAEAMRAVLAEADR